MALTNLDLDTLRTLVTAHDLGGYRQAAEHLGRTPSAVSLQMTRLQRDVGAAVFCKKGRRLRLTEIGEIVLRYGRRMLELNDEVLDTARGATLAGTVRVGCAQDFTENILPRALSRFTKLYPLVQIEVRIDRHAALARAVESKQLDLALTFGYPGLPTTNTVLGELPLVWIAGRQFTRREPLPLITFQAPCFIREKALDALDKAGIPWRIVVASESLAGLWAAARAGLGVTVRTGFELPASLVSGATLFSLPSLGSVPVTLHKGANGTAPVERLADIMRESLALEIPRNNRAGRQQMGNHEKKPLALQLPENAAKSKPAAIQYHGHLPR